MSISWEALSNLCKRLFGGKGETNLPMLVSGVSSLKLALDPLDGVGEIGTKGGRRDRADPIPRLTGVSGGVGT